MQRFYNFLIVCLLMLCVLFTEAQMGKNILQDTLMTVKINALAPPAPLYFSIQNRISMSNLFKQSAVIPGNYYTQNFGIICKKELQMQKTIALPVFFRLGSLDYVNWMEGKR
jgi:hypothetical protein